MEKLGRMKLLLPSEKKLRWQVYLGNCQNIHQTNLFPLVSLVIFLTTPPRSTQTHHRLHAILFGTPNVGYAATLNEP